MASVLGWVSQETDSETKASIQQVYQGVFSGTKPGKEEVQQKDMLKCDAAAIPASAAHGDLWILWSFTAVLN